jgi:hypothetical protein
MKKLLTTLTTLSFLSTTATPVFAQSKEGGTTTQGITNPAIEGVLGGNEGGIKMAESGSLFTNYFVQLWQAIIAVGGLAVLLYFVWGAVEWITAGGDSSKIEKARNKITQSVIGMIILVGSFAIIGVINAIFFESSGFNLLAPQFTPAN